MRGGVEQGQAMEMVQIVAVFKRAQNSLGTLTTTLRRACAGELRPD